jgi:hypothetical protein
MAITEDRVRDGVQASSSNDASSAGYRYTGTSFGPGNDEGMMLGGHDKFSSRETGLSFALSMLKRPFLFLWSWNEDTTFGEMWIEWRSKILCAANFLEYVGPS